MFWRGSYWTMTALREQLTFFDRRRFDRRGTQAHFSLVLWALLFSNATKIYKKIGPWKKAPMMKLGFCTHGTTRSVVEVKTRMYVRTRRTVDRSLAPTTPCGSCARASGRSPTHSIASLMQDVFERGYCFPSFSGVNENGCLLTTACGSTHNDKAVVVSPPPVPSDTVNASPIPPCSLQRRAHLFVSTL
jgi:hypothetical protein